MHCLTIELTCPSTVTVLQPIKDWMLFLILAILVAVDVVILGIVTVWALRLERQLVPREVCMLNNLISFSTINSVSRYFMII